MSVAIDTRSLDFVREFVRKRSAIVLEESKAYLVESRLGPLAKSEGYGSIDEMVTRLMAAPSNGLGDKVVEAMTTNETTFFRDVQPFEALKKIVLPELMDRRRSARRINIWFGASSTGQEPYSVSMIVREHFPSLLGWQLDMLGTDLSPEVLERARKGVYRQLEVNRGLPATYLVKYFEKNGADWQLKDMVRKMMRFEQMNLIEPWLTMPKLDVVFLRNVLIYFDVEVKREILNRVRRQLAPDGFLFLGGAETTLNLDSSFERVPMERAGCFKLKGGG